MLKNLVLILMFLTVSAVTLTKNALATELNIYSHRQPFLIQPFIDAYENETGTKVNIVYASKGLAQRLQSEGVRSPADLVLTVDIARLSGYANKDLLAPITSSILTKNIPYHLRDADNRWFSFSKRARVIVVAKNTKDVSKIRNYEDLSNNEWRGRICLRPGSHIYNRALLSSVINAVGEESAEAWAEGLVKNLARRPQGNDRAQVKAIYEGVCDISIINSYYYGKLKFSDKDYQRKWAESVRLVFPNQDNRGTHINISGGGVAKYSKNKEEAVRFLEFLVSNVAQALYGEINYEYPVRPGEKPVPELMSWGDFQEDQAAIERIAELAPVAQKIIDRVGW
ncbi:MAG: iron ABC transporter substrate-binding protein [Woeseia sp.]|nr:iron ABC transporter substrate-binding protein [Woeseia sp.]|tara:strand:- start:74 stop:1093 length:1020 start_codon:yes stop_codon:yes gene_type:complete